MRDPVSIIVPTLNEEGYLSTLLGSLATIPSPVEIIVVDGNSSDATVQIVHSFAPKFTEPSSLRVIPSLRGVARQRNLGAKEAKYEILLFLDADCAIPSPAQFDEMIAAFQDRRYVVGAARLAAIEHDWRARFVYTIFFIVQSIFLSFGKRYFGGGNMVTRRDIFLSIGGFDESLRLGEDVDYSERAAAFGKSGLLPGYVYTSARRFAQHGYWKMSGEYIRAFYKIVRSGKLSAKNIPTDIDYPFGAYETSAPREETSAKPRS